MKAKSRNGKPALDLIEEAIHLLRHAPPGVHICYYTGSVPFVLSLLHFWSDMSRGAFAYDRIGGGSLMVGLFFVWMKCWQAVSAAKLRSYLSGSDEIRWAPGRVAQLVMVQAALQPTALFVRPAAMLITLPYGWVRAFYENAVVLGDGSDGLRELCGKAKRQALLWPKQNHLVLLVMMCFGIVVWMNVAVLLATAPQLLKMFTGIETTFTRSPYAVLNTTFLTASVGCAYLFVNPVTKCIYLLRCFLGESVHSGDDLRLEMRRTTAAAMVSVLALLLFVPVAARAELPNKPAAPQIEPTALNSSIDRVLKRDEFAWRMPRQDPPKTGQTFFSRFLDDAMHSFKAWLKPLMDWCKEIIIKFRNWILVRHHDDDSNKGSFEGLKNVVNTVLWAICAVIICMVAWLLWKNRRGFRRRAHVIAEAVGVAPDLNSDEVVASQLPEDEWLKLAREMIGKGEGRLAVRAFYLATLAHLALRELIAIARYKSNRDYQRELMRRARTRNDLLEAFGRSISIFEGVWYGSNPTTDALLEQFTANFERIRTS